MHTILTPFNLLYLPSYLKHHSHPHVALGIIFSMLAAANNAIKAVNKTLQESTTNQLLALYLYGSMSQGTYQPDQSDINLIAVFADDLNLHELRWLLRPVWNQYGPVLQRMPVLASQSAFDHYMYVNPILARHLCEEANLIEGNQLVHKSTDVQYADVQENGYWAWIANQTMSASAAIAPSLLLPEEAQQFQHKLRSIVRQVYGRHVSMNEVPVTMVASLMATICQSISGIPISSSSEKQSNGAPLLINDLQALYETEDWLVLVLPDLSPSHLADYIVSLDWLTVADTLAGRYRGLRLTTPRLFRLILQYNRAADYYLNSFEHFWGTDPIAGLKIDGWRILQQLSQSASRTLIETLPHAYLTTTDSGLSILGHDLHNKLLNFQLRNELYCRIDGKPVDIPPIKLPNRSAPFSHRLDKIIDTLNWWVGYYVSAMKEIHQE